VSARSYDHASTKTKRPREVPVHPTLAKVLAEWREKGCAEILGPAPEPDDLLIPSRERAMRSRHHTRNKLLEDLERLGLRARRGHDLRRTFITLARDDSARADLLELVSHAPRGNIINIHTSMPWENLCAEVLKLRIELPQHADIIPIRRGVNAESPEPCGSRLTSLFTSVVGGPRKTGRLIVEARGVEARESECGLVTFRDVSCREGRDLREKGEGGEVASSVSCGLVESRCSSEVRATAEGSESTSESSHAPTVARPEPQAAAVSANESASARLAALEHLVDAVVVLLDAGEFDRAKALTHAWRNTRQ
jgi:hypothetical protein